MEKARLYLAFFIIKKGSKFILIALNKDEI